MAGDAEVLLRDLALRHHGEIATCVTMMSCSFKDAWGRINQLDELPATA